MAAMLISAQAVDYDGAVLSGAKLNVYDAGTTTPRAIYASKDLASGASSANPAVATATGGIAVWVDDSAGDIKITLTNSAGTTTYYSQDNIDPTNGNLVVFPLGGSDQTTGTGDSVVFANLTVGAVAFSGVTADPGADRIMFWDDSDTQVEWLSLGTGLSITDNTLSLDGDLEDISGLTPADGAVIIGDGTDFTTESGATLRASLGLAIGSDVLAYDDNLQAFANAFTAPTVDGAAGQFLTTDGAGVLTFATPAGGGDTLAAANETISGDWSFTGSIDYGAAPTVNSIAGDIDFRDYSPDTTGATDCMAALIQACSDASANGRRLVMPAGKFLLDVSAAETGAAALSSVADNGSGLARITTSTAHGFTNGQTVIVMMTDYYDGAWAVSNVTSTTFDISATYTAETFSASAYAARGETNMAVLREAVLQGAGGFVAANGLSAGDPANGTVFYITGSGRTPIILNRGAELRDVAFWYPDQVDDLSGGAATVYPHTIQLRDALDGLQAGPGLVALKDVAAYNSYHFLRARAAGGGMGNISFERVFAYAIRDCYDFGYHADKASWNKCYAGIGVYDRATDKNDTSDLAYDTYTNGVAIRHRGGDGIWISDSLFFGYADGLLFDGPDNTAFCQVLGSSFDGGRRAIKVTGDSMVQRLAVVGSKFVSANSGAEASAVPQIYCDSTGSPTNPAQWTFSSTQFLESEGAHIQIEGTLSVDIEIDGACRFFSPNRGGLASGDDQRASIHVNNSNASISLSGSSLAGIGGTNKILAYLEDAADVSITGNDIGTYNTLIKADTSSVDNFVFEGNRITPTGSQTYLSGGAHLKGSGYTTLTGTPSYQEDVTYKNTILDSANPVDFMPPRNVVIRNTHDLSFLNASGTAVTAMDMTAGNVLRLNKASGTTFGFYDGLATELLSIGGGNVWSFKVAAEFETYFQCYSRTDAELTSGAAVTAGAGGVAYDSDRKALRVSDGSNWSKTIAAVMQGGGAQSAFSSTGAPGDTYVWSAEVTDPDNIHASGVVTFPRKGFYAVSAVVTWDFDDAGAVSGDVFQLVLLHEDSGGTDLSAAKVRVQNTASGQASTITHLMVDAAASDTIKLAVRRLSGTGSLKPFAGDGQLHTLTIQEIRL